MSTDSSSTGSGSASTTTGSSTGSHPAGPLDHRFEATLERSDATGGWTYLVMTGSRDFFGTGGLVKVRGTVDGEPVRTSFMALGDGRHKLPVAAAVRRAIGKEAGDTVEVHLTERLPR